MRFECETWRQDLRPAAGLLGFEGGHVDGEAVLHIGLEQPLVGFVDFLDGDDLNVGGDVVLAAEIEHLLSFGECRRWGSRKGCGVP